MLFKKFIEFLGGLTLRDFVPWLGWIDRLNGLENKIGKVAKEV